MRTGRRLAILGVVGALLMPPWGAVAQESDLGLRRFGIRGGVTVDPDQVHVGFHVDAGHFADSVRFQPSLEVGFGDHLIVATINLDALYEFRSRPWRPYAGGGLGVALIDFDDERFGGRADGLETEAGLNLFGGFEFGERNRYLLELRAGLGDIPDLKVTVGMHF